MYENYLRVPFYSPLSAGSVPAVSAVSYPYVDVLGGGQRVVVTVDSSTGCTGITAGAVAFTSFAIDDATHVSGIPGAHAAGVVDVVVTNATGPSTTGTGLIEYFDPTSLVDLYLDGTQYNATTGTWTARKGSDLTQVTAGLRPAAGATLGSRQTVDFDAVNDRLEGAALNSYVTTSAWFSLVLFAYDAISTNKLESAAYDDVGLWCDGTNAGGFAGMHLGSTPELRVYSEGTPTNVRRAATSIAAAGTWVGGLGRFDGSNLYARSGSGAWSAGRPCVAPIVEALGHSIYVGTNYSSLFYFDGRMAVVAIGKTVPSDANILKLLGVVNQQWGTAL